MNWTMQVSKTIWKSTSYRWIQSSWTCCSLRITPLVSRRLPRLSRLWRILITQKMNLNRTKLVTDSKTLLTRCYWRRVSTTRFWLRSAHWQKRTMWWVTLSRSCTPSSSLRPSPMHRQQRWRELTDRISMSSTKKPCTLLTSKRKMSQLHMRYLTLNPQYWTHSTFNLCMLLLQDFKKNLNPLTRLRDKAFCRNP